MKGLPLKYDENREILIFHIYFLNKYISLNIRLTCLTTTIHVFETNLEGRVSQNFDIVIRRYHYFTHRAANHCCQSLKSKSYRTYLNRRFGVMI